MREWLDRIVLIARVEWAVWRARRNPVTVADLAAAMDDALRRFPDDRVHQEARARSELALRELFGQRKFDA